jgi:hypothetical protein
VVKSVVCTIQAHKKSKPITLLFRCFLTARLEKLHEFASACHFAADNATMNRQTDMPFILRTAAHVVTCAVAVFSLSIASTHPTRAASQDLPFDLLAQRGSSATITVRVETPGCILAQIRPWIASTPDGKKADRLQLTLRADNRTFPNAAISGPASQQVPLWLSYAAFPSDIGRVVTWTIGVSTLNNSGTARGVVRIEYPPTPTPCVLRAEAIPGGVFLSWFYTGERFDGSFLIERSSNNGAAWRTVAGCTTRVGNRSSYSCTDETATEGNYLYRACAITEGNTCTASNVTPPVRIRLR